METVILALLFMRLIAYLIRMDRHGPCLETVDFQEVAAFLSNYEQSTSSHLVFLNDKQIYWAQDKSVLISYRKIMNKLVVLGDPIGDEQRILEAIKEFKGYALQSGCVAIFYQISPRYMHYYHDLGYRFVKLGEEGKVALREFSLAGKKGAKLRTRTNKFARQGNQFTVVQPPYSAGLLYELKQVSDSWLNERHEKGFSVSFFDIEYVSMFPVACLRDPEGKLIAFATLGGEGKQIAIDLMRSTIDSPHGTMDMVFVSTFSWAKENGYHSCSLGVAPLANVGECKHARLYERLGRLFFLYGNCFYKFKGLKEYKEKFAHIWEAKYLAYKKTFAMIIIFQIFLLIHFERRSNQKVVSQVRGVRRKLS